LLSLTETEYSFVPICLHYVIPTKLMPLTNTRDKTSIDSTMHQSWNWYVNANLLHHGYLCSHPLPRCSWDASNQRPIRYFRVLFAL